MKPLMKPELELTTEEIRYLALKTMSLAKFPVLASVEGMSPRARPVSPVRTEDFTVWVASLRRSDKTGQLAENANVELCYFAPNHDQVRIEGLAEPITDPSIRRDIFEQNPLLRAYLGSADNPEYLLYKVIPLRVRYMKEWSLRYHEVQVREVEPERS